jgi:endonuclease/exonuclease/phosphatase family metal-dependent hydrolase
VSIFNTHFDHAGTEARAKSAAFIRALVNSSVPNHPAVVAGDFNCAQTEEPYAILTQQDSSGVLDDTQALAADRAVGPPGTFCGFPLTEDITGPRIDFLFVTQDITVKRQETLRASRAEGFLSDHLPVIATLTIP